MFRNYFKTAWRNIIKNKTFSFINIFGLAVSMSVCLLIILIVNDQNSYDNFQQNKDRIYRVHTLGKNNSFTTASSALPLADELRKFNGIEASAALVRNIGGDVFYDDKIASGGGYFADGNLFKVLDYKLKEGDVTTALNNPYSLVISEEMAKLLFKEEDPIGKVVKFNDTGINPGGPETGSKETSYGQFIITGVLQPNPGKTGLPFKLLASLSTLNSLTQQNILHYPTGDWDNVWTNYTYVLLKKGKTKADLQTTLNTIDSKKYPTTAGSQFLFTAEALSDLAPGPAIGNMTVSALPEGVLIFLGVLCLVIMLCACLNYTNLSVARSLTRVKEVGIRKVSGATRRQVFQQFIAESVITSLIALVFAFLILLVLQPLFMSLSLNRFLDIGFTYSPKVYLLFFGFSLLVGLVAGLLPAGYISLFNPIQIFRSLNSIKGFKGLTLRKVLLVTQFVVSLIFIISASMIYAQTVHVFHFDYGFNKDNVVNIKLYKTENYDRFAQAISTNKNVLAVGACAFPPSSGTNNSTLIYKVDNHKDSLQTGVIDIDGKSLNVWDIKLVAGHNLPSIAADSIDQYVLINEKMIGAFHYPSAAAAVGQRLEVEGHAVEIAGVVKDFQFLEVTRGIEPLLLRNRKREFGYVTVRIAAGNEAATVQFLQATWKKVNPNTKFDYSFFDTQLHMFHSMMRDAASVIGFLALLAVVISCLGLLGMALYTAETRRKEVGIRKVLGSGVAEIVVLLSKSYVVLLSIAILIATPIAYLLNNAWLQFFASRVSISPAILLLSIGGLSAICLAIVGLQAWQVSRMNPVKSLRVE